MAGALLATLDQNVFYFRLVDFFLRVYQLYDTELAHHYIQ